MDMLAPHVARDAGAVNGFGLIGANRAALAAMIVSGV